MSTKILVTGSLGQLGSEIQDLSKFYTNYQFYFHDKDDLDILDKDALQSFFSENSIDYIINCAAYTAVDKAEEEKELAFLLNHKAVKNLLDASSNTQAKLFQISTDYVFGGIHNTPFLENEKTQAESIYGESKLQGEIEAINSNRAIVIRTSWLYSSYGNNFVKTIMKYAQEREELNVVYDQIGAPTYAKDLAKAILDIIDKVEKKQNNFETGIYHYANEGVLSWFDFAVAITEISNINTKINAVNSEMFPTAAKRPPYSVLSKDKIKNTYNIEIPYWRDSLVKCIQILQENN
jgi:dTDP-4-dehydrorhamnose reductase